MSRPKPTEEDFEERKTRAREVKIFMHENCFTEVKLADTLGVSRRTVQMIRAGLVTPAPSTLRKLEALLKQYEKAPTLLTGID
jgi:ribosome-binding protein aMBF1 (putative translation factor)